MKTLHKVLWAAALSNGERIYEGKGDWIDRENDLSPWQRLDKKLASQKIEIRSLWLYVNEPDGQEFHLPGSGDPKFRIFQERDKPYDYNMFRAIARDTGLSSTEDPNKMKVGKTVETDHFTVIEAYYPGETISARVQKNAIQTIPLKDFTTLGYRLQIWVNERNPKMARAVVAPMPE